MKIFLIVQNKKAEGAKIRRATSSSPPVKQKGGWRFANIFMHDGVANEQFKTRLSPRPHKGGWRFASHICAQPKDKCQRITFLVQIIHKFYYNRKIHFARKREDVNYTVTSGLFLKDKAVHLRYDLPDRHIYYFFGCLSKKHFEVVP